jgi:hypothetical protein
MMLHRLIPLIAWLALLIGFSPQAMAASVDLACHASPRGERALCDYRTFDAARTRQLRIKIDGTARPARDAALFPAHWQTSAVLFLIDVSDPARARTVARNVDVVRAMIARLHPYQKAGVAVFDTDVRVLAPIGAAPDALNAALGNVHAAGLATEFYKSVIHAEKLLGQTGAARRALVLMSDGKAEDRAFHADDAIAEARADQIAVIGLGYAERPEDAPDLQTLLQLANATHGAYYDLTGATDLPPPLRDAPLGAIEGGGSFAFDSGDLFGHHAIVLELKLADGSQLTAARDFDFNAGRDWQGWSRALVIGGWVWLLAGCGGLIALIALIVLVLRRRGGQAPGPVAVHATLVELDGAGTRHDVRATAVRIGRGPDNDIRLRNTSVSTNHATISRKGDAWQIVDLGSSNGVIVNARAVTQATLRDDDIVELGEVRLRFCVTQADHAWSQGDPR